MPKRLEKGCKPWLMNEFPARMVPEVVAHLYGIRVGINTVYNWMNKGLPFRKAGSRGDPDANLVCKLSYHYKLGIRFVSLSNLITFCDNT